VAAGSTAARRGFLSRQPRWLADLLGRGRRSAAMTDQEWRIAYLERLYALAVRNLDGFDRLVHYSEIPGVLDDLRYGLLGLPGRDISRAVRDALASDSKRPGRPFEPVDRSESVSQAEPRVSGLRSHYEALESRRLSLARVST
jgi:hypothetical protein